jgi:2-oxoisovalerate dehydrogenase E1 component
MAFFVAINDHAMISVDILLKAYRLMCTAAEMAATYERNRPVCKYVHSTSRGHEAIQLATAMQLQPCDWVSPYYRDESILLGLGFEPYQLMLQLLAKGDDIFTGGREYYSHPNYRGVDRPGIIHQSSATGMQAIPATGIAQGIQYLQRIGRLPGGETLQGDRAIGESPIVVCSLGDASVTEGEVSEAFQFAVLKRLPIIYLIQDNEWGISVRSEESRVMDAYEYAGGFRGMGRLRIDGSDFAGSWVTMGQVIDEVRRRGGPYIVQANVPLLGHHTSGVRREFYRDQPDLAAHASRDPLPQLKARLLTMRVEEGLLQDIEKEAIAVVARQFAEAVRSAEPDPAAVGDFVFVPTPVVRETGDRAPEGREKVIMVDAALFAIRELMEDFPEAVLYGQDVGRRLGGVFREAATLGEKFGDHRVFNTAIQEAYIIGSTAGMSAVGVKPIVEIQFADYIYPGLNQLVTEISKSCYLSQGKFPVQTLIRIPIGAYGGGGPYHSGSIETTLLSIKGIKIVYPSNAADMKGLMKAAFLDPNPVVMLEHKGLYWSKVPGTEEAKTVEPSRDYVLPLGVGRRVLEADDEYVESGETACIITYGMGVYWAKSAAARYPGLVEIVDLRTLYPLDDALVYGTVRRHGKCIVLTEEQQNNSFAEALAWRITKNCWSALDAPVEVIGALNLPAVPMNVLLENAMLPNADKVAEVLGRVLRG